MRKVDRLDALKVKRAKKPGLYADGGGLYLQVSKTGSKSWIFRFAIAGKERAAGLGPLHTFSLKEARERAKACRQQLADGIDPIEARSAVRSKTAVAAAKAMTFEQCAIAYIDAKTAEWTSAKHRHQWQATLEQHAFPLLGALPVAAIDTSLVFKTLQPIWSTKRETASRVRGRIEAVLDWATVSEYRKGDNPARWKGHLEHKFAGKGAVEHHAALPYADLPDFMGQLRALDGIAARALEFCILTAARSGEVLGAMWSETDLEAAVWVVPPERMKSGREHRKPLSAPALALLQAQWEVRESDYIFPGRGDGRPLGAVALQQALHRIRSDCTVHGMRSTFRDWVSECTNFPSEVAEMALAHAVGDKVEAAYRRGDLFAKRQQLAQAWADYCATPTEDKVVTLRRANK